MNYRLLVTDACQEAVEWRSISVPMRNVKRSNGQCLCKGFQARTCISMAMVSSMALFAAEETIFEDAFDEASRGALKPSLVKEPPPVGMGYTTTVPSGFLLKNWIIADVEADGPRRSFWVIPLREGGRIDTFAEQAGRSRNSIAYARTPVPGDTAHYVIEFRQRANDNDYIGYILIDTIPVNKATAFQPFELRLPAEIARLSVKDGVRLRLTGGTDPLWIIWRNEDPENEEQQYLPQLLQRAQ